MMNLLGHAMVKKSEWTLRHRLTPGMAGITAQGSPKVGEVGEQLTRVEGSEA